MNLLPITRIAAVGSLGAFILSLAAIWTGVVPEPVRLPLIAVVLVIFLASVAAYLVGFGTRLGRPSAEESRLAALTDPSDAYPVAELKSWLAWRSSLAAGFRIWAAAILALILGLAGSLVSEQVGTGALAIGGVLVLIAITLFVRSFVRVLRTRQEVWRQLGRRRWEFTAYMVATFVLGVTAGIARSMYHSKQVTGAAFVLALFLLYRLRSFMQDLW